ncbi:MAG: outer membrane protein, partial [Sulfurimonas sp.]|uniref:TolC family protein n=1 Tax=Sulfurimonas sp. TaxID=2022749 RepID=UPI0039E6E5C3
MRIILLFISAQIALFGLNLAESIDLAMSNSPKVSLSQSNINYNEYMKDEARSAYHPTIQAGFTWKKLENPTSFAFSPSHNFSLGLKYNLF